MHREFIDNGIKVFSLYGHDTTNCECGDPACKAIGKHPRTSNWQHSPLWSSEQLSLMEETNQFRTGYGVLCKNLIVIDIDARNGGTDSYAALINDHPQIAASGLIVATGSGNGSKHIYFKAPDDIALLRHLPQYKGIDFQSGSSFVVGPGSLHASGKRYTILHGSPSEIDMAPESLIQALKKPERHRTEYNGATMDVSHAEISEMVAAIPNTCNDYELFIRIGMAIHHVLNGEGYDIWDAWSQQSDAYDDKDMPMKWHSFGRSSMPVTIGTLIHYAEQAGWKQPVTFTDTPPTHTHIDTLDTSDIDIRRPPGFVGEVKSWIDDQCRFPVESLSLGASLLAIGNIMGLRYTDDVTSVTTNLLVFNIAGSSVGKEAILQATNQIMREADLSPAVHGVIKSEQEITRNLINHQPAYYIVDEFGIQFAKIVNSQKRGGAVHLEGIPGKVMEVFSKANGYYLIGGDVRNEIRKELQKEAAQLQKKIENNGDGTPVEIVKEKLAQTLANITSLEHGLKDPFLSLMGFTTPETFEGLIDVSQATSGFVGRSLLINELETNPKAKKRFKKRPMSEKMINQLSALRYGGHFDSQAHKIEYRHERSIIPTTPDAVEYMDKVEDWIHEYAEQQKSTTRLEAVVRRGYELMCKVSLILACEGIRTLEHVRYGFAIAKWDMENKLRLVVSNDTTAKSDMRLYASITRYIDKDHGVTIGVIKNKLRSYREEDVRKALDDLIAAGEVVKEETTHKYTGKVVEKFFKA